LDSYIQNGKYQTAIPGDRLVTGDKAFVTRFLASGGKQTTSNRAVVYHFQEGEKSNARPSRISKISSGIAIANDQLIGVNGEETLWNYLIDDLREVGFKVCPIPLGVNQTIPYRLSRPILWKKPTARLLFRNATFLRALRGPWRQIVLLQDQIENKRLLRNQSEAVNGAHVKITNSPELLLSHNSNPQQHTYLQPLPVNTDWEKVESNSQGDSNISAIFVGAFNETKGWSSVKKIIENNQNVSFTCVSKYPDDLPFFDNGRTPSNVTILRCLSTSQLIDQVDTADIFIVGSPFETQCLAAMEAATRNIPVCMTRTGIFSQLSQEIRSLIGEFDEDLAVSFESLIRRLRKDPNSLQPAQGMCDAGLSVAQIRSAWVQIFKDEMEQSFLFKVRKSPYEYLKSLFPISFKRKLRQLLSIT
jgi:hypothetical protein